MNKLIAVTIGDIKGIGIYLLLDNWKKNKIKNFILVCNIDIIKRYIKKNKIKANLNITNLNDKKIKYSHKYLNIFTYLCDNHEENTYKSLQFAHELCIKKKCIGIVTLPLRKDLIKKKIDKNFIGHTEFFQNLEKRENSNMILYHKKIIISPLTTHISIKSLSKKISNKKYLFNQIVNLNNSLKYDFNFKKPSIIISGLNPHAGENGHIGNEEINYIIPIIKKLKKIGINIEGPFSADSILIKKNLGKYDCFVFIYHDQALIPFKFISQFSGINYTGNLSIIRTSPDHGTAYKLIGSKKISNKSILNCFKLIKEIYKNRLIHGKS